MLLLLAILLASAEPPKADLLFEGGVVYAAPDAAPRKASIVVGDGKILFVGDPAKARRQAKDARVVDLKGRFVFPGWADAHMHLTELGKSKEIADLRGSADAEEAAARIAKTAAALPPGVWVEARGWDQNLWPGAEFPDARALDSAVGGRPAVARRVDGHAMWVNQAALKAAGIDAATRDPDGGRILRRSDGSPSGVLVDNAMALVVRVLPPPTAADLERRLLSGAASCAALGLTEIQDASGYGPEAIAALERLASRGALAIRVYATVSPDHVNFPASLEKGPRLGGGADFLTIRAVKAYADGALGSRGAALLADYSDEPGKRGLLVTAPDRLAEIARDARRAGWQVWIHAIGDRGNRVALDAFEAAALAVADAPEGASRPRIEHAQVIAPEDFPRFARYGVIASVQPTHATSDMPWAQARIGPARIAGAYAWRRLKVAGARLAGGSDAPVESENPLRGFYAAVTRRDGSGQPPGGWRPAEKLSRAEALALFTSDAAFAAFEETWRGRIAPGFAADLTVFAQDPMTAAEEDIAATPVAMTIVGGRIVYAAAAAP
ncbi:MAG: amidohydrolase [Acidobacteriota bacterium]